MELITVTQEGLYCTPGGFYIDPWSPVDPAVVTHAHSDHASVGHVHYMVAAQRILASVDASAGPIYCHGAVEALNDAYRASEVALPQTQRASRSRADIASTTR